MKILYFFRVLLIGFESATLCLSWFAWTYFLAEIDALASAVSLNQDLLKYLMLVPIGLAAWVVKELLQLPFENEAATKLLVGWPEYWKLKLHIWCSVGFAVLFACTSIVPWLVTSGVSTGLGLLLFATSILGQLSLATSVYSARFRIKELLVHAPKP